MTDKDNSMAGSHAGLCLTIDGLNALRPCAGEFHRVRAALRKLNPDEAHCFTAAEAREAGCTFDDIVWAAAAVCRNDRAVERRLRHWMADCAAHVLHIFEERYPADDRPRRAIEAARLLADGEIDAVASAVATAAATAASAAWDDAWTTIWTVTMAAAMAAWAARAAVSTARAAVWTVARDARAAARDAMDASAAEEQWQFDRLILWLSDPEPEPLPLPAKVLGEAALTGPQAA